MQGDGGATGDSTEVSWTFCPTPKVASGRSVAFAETEVRVRPLLSSIPVTRVADLTPLDIVGLPVFCACTPLAADLAVHLGKGTDADGAWLSAVMEAIERVCAEEVEGARCVHTSFDALRSASADRVPLDPRSFCLPPDSTYRPDQAVTWAPGHDLIQDRPVWVTRDLVVTPPREGLLLDIDTNGLASGNTHLEAVVHGACEVIERDAFSQVDFCAMFADGHDRTMSIRTVDLDSVPPVAASVAERLQSAGQHVIVQEVTSDVGVATFAAYVLEPSFPSPTGTVPMLFLGLGANPDAGVALVRALLEANQARLARIQGARDSYNTASAHLRTATLLDVLRRLAPGPVVSFDSVASAPSGDLLEDLEFLLDRLRSSGVQHCVVVDLTRADLGIPVVRVRVPGLSQFFVDPRRVDPRCWRWLL
jgi:ribosomal protein S12 methylthiotransferase accessory factor